MSHGSAQRQKLTTHRVERERKVSPDDVKARLIEVRERERADRRSAAEKWLGDPEPGRSALSQRLRQSEAERARGELINHLRNRSR